MATDRSAQTIFKDVVKTGVTSILKPARFRKSGMNFYRRHLDVVQIVNLQSSHGSTFYEKTFYINVGLAFDAICQLTHTEISETPKEHECTSDARGTRDRLEKLIEHTPQCWILKIDEDTTMLVHQLSDAMRDLVTELDKLDSPKAYREHRWFNRSHPSPETVQILYLLGDLEGAWTEIQTLAKAMADRKNANSPEWWVQRLGLTDI